MAESCSRFFTAVVQRQLEHDGDPRLARHLANATLKHTPAGDYIVKESRHSPKKIDLAVAAVIAFDRALHGEASRKAKLIWLHDDRLTGRTLRRLKAAID